MDTMKDGSKRLNKQETIIKNQITEAILVIEFTIALALNKK